MTLLKITIDGDEALVPPGFTVAAALVATNRTAFRRSARHESPRGVFCGMGVCFECLATIDGEPHRRTCLAEVADGMVIETGFT